MNEEGVIMARNRLLSGNTAHSCKASYIKTAIEALEKQIAKNPVDTTQKDYEIGGIKLYACPTCNELIVKLTDSGYCHYCGQKLKWD